MFRRLDAEADADGQLGMLLDALDGARNQRRIGQRRAGDAVHRDIVDEAGGVFQHGGQALLVGGRRCQADEVDPLADRRNAELVIHLGRQVDDDQPVDTGGQRVIEEFFDAVDVDRIVIAHHHDRRRIVGFAEVGSQLQRLLQRLATLQRTLTGQLDRRTVGHRIGKGHAEFDDVGPCLRQRLHDAERGVVIRIAAHEIGHERRTAIGLQLGKAFVHACGHVLQSHSQNLADGEDVLVATAGEVHQDDLVLAHRRRTLDHLGNRMRGLERRDDAFEAGQGLEGLKRFVVHDRHIIDPADIAEPRMFRTDARIIETGRNRMAFLDLAITILKQIGAVAVQDARRTSGDRRAMFVALQALAAGFDANDLHRGIVEEGVEDADRIRAAADGSDNEIRQTAFGRQHLLFRLRADHRLEIADHLRIGMRAGRRADEIIGVLDIGDPVAQRLVHGVLQRATACRHRFDFRSKQLHAENVRRLTLDVGCAHVDDAGKSEAGGNSGRSDAVLAGASFRNDARLAHALGEQDLADAVVDLVRAGVVQLLAFEVNLRAAEFGRQPLGEIERAGAADIVRAQMLQFRLKGRIGLRLVPLVLQIEDQRHQCFGNETTAIDAEAAVFVRPGTEGIRFRRFVHSQLPEAMMGASAPSTASKNSSIIATLLTPGALSTPEETSIPRAVVFASASATLSLFSPPDSM
ncbi:hypothetical protein RHECNPAF_334005 [Rhizobium etli CNPAF512]|nr:hypothetical protein RHECNPAF_334005 [Rhizobium etli CNPAF512]